MPHILIVEDEAAIADTLVFALQGEGFTATWLSLAEAALEFQQRTPADLLILDVGLPDISGFEACRRLRRFSEVPVIFLTARDAEIDRVVGLEIGADDYVVKPFNPRELIARVKAVLRRAQGNEPAAAGVDVLNFANLRINRSEYVATAAGNTVQLTAKEMDLLWHLASHPGRVFSREQLLESVWGYEYFGDTRTVDTHIKRIRHKLGVQEDSPWDIKTVWGVGYKFEVHA